MFPMATKLKRYLWGGAAVLCVLLGTQDGYGASYHYYLPYFTQASGYWTGLALSNSGITQSAHVVTTIYGEHGEEGGAVTTQIPPRGQSAFMPASATVERGWMAVDSDQPLTGFVFFGTQSVIADVTLEKTLATTLHVPHVAQNEFWDTRIFVCNPHAADTTVSVSFVTSAGQEASAWDYQVPGWGRADVALTEVLEGTSASGGKVEITASQAIAGFALFSNAKAGGFGYAGISAIDPAVGEGPPSCNIEVYPDRLCAGISIGAPFSAVRSLYGAPSSTAPSDTEWINYFWYDDLGISGAVNDQDQDEILDNTETVLTVIATAPYSGTTTGCNGVGSSRSSVLSEFGVCDYSEYSAEWGGMMELYEAGIGFVYDAQDAVSAIVVFDADTLVSDQTAAVQRTPQLLRFARIAGVMNFSH